MHRNGNSLQRNQVEIVEQSLPRKSDLTSYKVSPLNGLDSRFNNEKVLNVDRARKVLLYTVLRFVVIKLSSQFGNMYSFSTNDFFMQGTSLCGFRPTSSTSRRSGLTSVFIALKKSKFNIKISKQYHIALNIS